MDTDRVARDIRDSFEAIGLPMSEMFQTRRERIATAVISGILAGRDPHREPIPVSLLCEHAIAVADRLIAELSK